MFSRFILSLSYNHQRLSPLILESSFLRHFNPSLFLSALRLVSLSFCFSLITELPSPFPAGVLTMKAGDVQQFLYSLVPSSVSDSLRLVRIHMRWLQIQPQIHETSATSQNLGKISLSYRSNTGGIGRLVTPFIERRLPPRKDLQVRKAQRRRVGVGIAFME